jgi:hypothetical protein
MTRHFDVDRALEEWLAEGPSQLPDRAIDRIVRQLDQTNQRKPSWLPGREPMNRMILAIGGVAAAIALTLVAFGMYFGLNTGAPGVGGAPSPTPTVQPTVAPTPVPTEPDGVLYTSERHGYSLLLPDESWTVEEKPGTWGHGQTFNPDGYGVDSVFADLSPPRTYILLNSQPVPSGTTLEQWAIDYDSASRRMWPECEVERSESALLDGETARLNTYLCAWVDNDEDAVEAAALHGGRAYVIRVFGGGPELDPRPIIDEWISRFRFTD